MSNGLLVTLRPKAYRDIEPDNVKILLDSTDHVVLSIMAANPFISITGISSESNLSIKTVRYHIDKLRKNNIISREGGKRGGKWIINIGPLQR